MTHLHRWQLLFAGAFLGASLMSRQLIGLAIVLCVVAWLYPELERAAYRLGLKVGGKL